MRVRLAFVLALLTACSAQPYRLDAPRVATDVILLPYAIHEECAALNEGERIEFRFRSTQPVAFNIHYHEGNAVIAPVTLDSVIDEAGDFSAASSQLYCLMWEAGAAGASLDYRLRPLPPPP